MILFEWDAPEGNPEKCAYTWMLSHIIGKIPTWWENSVLRNRNMIGKIPTWWENSVRGRKKVFRCMDHLVLRHPSYMRGFTFPFYLSAYSIVSLTSVSIFSVCCYSIISISVARTIIENVQAQPCPWSLEP
jgi:hypothetical protein